MNMSDQRGALLLAIILCGLASCSTTKPGTADARSEATSPRQRTLLDAGWLFHLGDISPNTDVITVGYADSEWRHVDVPHDYLLDGTYVQSEDRAKRNSGYLPVEVGW